jgi:hypothetical protein
MTMLIKLLESPWFWVNVFFSVFGGIIVWRGLSIEANAEKLLPPDSFKADIFGDIIDRYKLEIRRGEKLVKAGVIIEVIAALGISIISGLESAALGERTSQAEKDAGFARLQVVSLSNDTVRVSVNLEEAKSNNLILRSNIVVLERELQPRRITMEQRTNFIALTQLIPKIPIKILIGQEGSDTEDFAKDLREMFTMAGFPINPDAGIYGVNRDPSIIMTRILSAANFKPELIFLKFGTNNMTTHFGPGHGHFIGGPSMPFVTQTNNDTVYGAIDECITNMGIKPNG